MYRSLAAPVSGFLGQMLTVEDAAADTQARRAAFEAQAAADTAVELNVAREAFGLPPVAPVVETMNGKPVVLAPVIVRSHAPIPPLIIVAGLIGAYFLVTGKAGRRRSRF